MLELPHAALGAAIASAIPNPAISIPISLASHFLTDFVPHWNPHIHDEIRIHGHILKRTYLILFLDSISALVFGLFMAFSAPTQTQTINILACCFTSVFPDIIEIPYCIFRLHNKFIKNLVIFQRNHQFNVSIIPGLLSQLAVLIFSLILIYS